MTPRAAASDSIRYSVGKRRGYLDVTGHSSSSTICIVFELNMTDSDAITTVLRSFASTMDVESMVTDEFMYIRPSGNPSKGVIFVLYINNGLIMIIICSFLIYVVGHAGIKELFARDDCSVEILELWSVESIRFIGGGNVAIAVAKIHQKFTYAGTPNDDVATITAVLCKQGDGSWKIEHVVRARGVNAAHATPKSA